MPERATVMNRSEKSAKAVVVRVGGRLRPNQKHEGPNESK
jgi:hypothetical protein